MRNGFARDVVKKARELPFFNDSFLINYLSDSEKGTKRKRGAAAAQLGSQAL